MWSPALPAGSAAVRWSPDMQVYLSLQLFRFFIYKTFHLECEKIITTKM
jgi:hypothetical protein